MLAKGWGQALAWVSVNIVFGRGGKVRPPHRCNPGFPSFFRHSGTSFGPYQDQSGQEGGQHAMMVAFSGPYSAQHPLWEVGVVSPNPARPCDGRTIDVFLGQADGACGVAASGRCPAGQVMPHAAHGEGAAQARPRSVLATGRRASCPGRGQRRRRAHRRAVRLATRIPPCRGTGVLLGDVRTPRCGPCRLRAIWPITRRPRPSCPRPVLFQFRHDQNSCLTQIEPLWHNFGYRSLSGPGGQGLSIHCLSGPDGHGAAFSQ